MQRINSNWIAVLLVGLGVIVSIYFLRENQFNYLTDDSEQRTKYYFTLAVIAGLFQTGFFFLWFINYVLKTQLSYYLLLSLAVLTIAFLYLWEKTYGDPGFLELLFS